MIHEHRPCSWSWNVLHGHGVRSVAIELNAKKQAVLPYSIFFNVNPEHILWPCMFRGPKHVQRAIAHAVVTMRHVLCSTQHVLCNVARIWCTLEHVIPLENKHHRLLRALERAVERVTQRYSEASQSIEPNLDNRICSCLPKRNERKPNNQTKHRQTCL